MVTVVMLAILVKRSAFAPRTLALALIAVLLWDPLASLAAGFWLSFGAVGVLMLGSAGSRPLRYPEAIGWKALLSYLGSLGRQWGYFPTSPVGTTQSPAVGDCNRYVWNLLANNATWVTWSLWALLDCCPSSYYHPPALCPARYGLPCLM